MSVKRIFSAPEQGKAVSMALLLLRIVVGLAFMHHGWGKIQHATSWMGPDAATPAAFQLLAAISEFGGGLAWIVGLLTPLAALGILSTMTVAVWTHAIRHGDPFVASKGGPAFELALVYLSIALLLLAAGPGRWSLDRAIFGGRSTSALD
jgi:putative oxidoreductase